jgi:hypothetical protein
MTRCCKWKWVCVAVTGALLTLGALGWFKAFPRQHGGIANAQWVRGSKALTLTIHVKDGRGQPLPDARVAAETNSGTQESTTDRNGHAVIVLSERELLAVYLSDAKILEWPFYWGLDCTQGQDITITTKK